MPEALIVLLLLAAALAGVLYLLRPKAPEEAPKPKVLRADDDGIVRVQVSDDVKLKETFGTGSAPHLRHTPAPGTAVVEAITGDHQPLAFDTLKISQPAPAGIAAPWTNVIAQPGPNKVHYKYGLFAVGDEPFDLPSHLKRSEASYYRVWWSMENAHA